MSRAGSRITLLLLLAAGAFGRGSPAAAPAPPRMVLCSFYPMYVMALNVVGDLPGVKVECLTGPVIGCLHDYQLTPANLKTIATADVLIANGAGMESFIDKALAQAPRLKVVEAAQGIPLDFNDNPHLWVSPAGAIRETRNIAQGLAAWDPPRADRYWANAAAYVRQLEQLRRQMHEALDGLTNRNIITFHDAFPYFAREFNLHVVGVVEREPGSDPSAGELARLIGLVRKEHVQALFAEPQYSAKAAELIERETGIRLGALDPAVTGPLEPGRARDAYVRAMEENLRVLRDVLGR